MTFKYNTAVYIGRFQPFHIGHERAVAHALSIAENVLIFVGSTNTARTPKNPLTYDERVLLIKSYFTDEELKRIKFYPLKDYLNDNDWVASIQSSVNKDTNPDSKIVLIGHRKDDSSYYLDIFPQWEFNENHWIAENKGAFVDATKIREFWFENNLHYAKSVINKFTYEFLNKMATYEFGVAVWHDRYVAFRALVAYHDNIKKYKKDWAAAPYPPMFVTVDAIVIQSGHVLVVKRKNNPGRHLYAIPGGFLDQHERIVDGAIRELREETNIQLQDKVLKRCLHSTHVFDKPDRSLRGRTITHAHLFRLDDTAPLPRVHGGDDAEKAEWLPLSALDDPSYETMFFEDHYQIIDQLRKVL